MERRQFLQQTGATMAAAMTWAANGAEPAPARRPNILWITCEDMSPHLGCFGEPQAITPNLDRLASQGRLYTRAFSVSGVCAPSRSCLITGVYPSSLGTQHMRCKNPPPEHIKCFPEYLREAGYYCTNNVKTDYNFDPPASAWDESSRDAHWRNRPDPDQPFFAVFNFTVTHESSIGTPMEKQPDWVKQMAPNPRHDPAKAVLPPYYPDGPVTRKHWAHYFDLITVMDKQAGNVLEELEADSLADNTIVFFYSDHGVGLPWAKRWMYNQGLHVPLIIRWPGTIAPGEINGDLVSFVDFAPTVLSLAGVPIPAHMQGRAFLGEQRGAPREYIFAARDRMDERYDILRAVRDSRFKYIRNYEPYRPYGQYLEYPESWPVMQEIRRFETEGKLEGPQTLFLRNEKPPEELFDTETDPREIHNLADDPAHTATLERMCAALDAWMDEIHDLALLPEMELQAWFDGGRRFDPIPPAAPYAPLGAEGDMRAAYGRTLNDWVAELNGADRLKRLRAIKGLAAHATAAQLILVAALRDPDPAVGHWAAIALGEAGVTSAVAELEAAMLGGSWTVRLAAARTLCKLGRADTVLPTLDEAMKLSSEPARLHATETLEFIAAKSDTARSLLEKALEDPSGYVVRIAKHAQQLAAKTPN